MGEFMVVLYGLNASDFHHNLKSKHPIHTLVSAGRHGSRLFLKFPDFRG
jgi:hypothetical protein